MRYSFECKTCGNLQDLYFPASEYNEQVESEGDLDGLHRTEICDNCGTKNLYRHISIDTMPTVLGGTNGYKSMERYWAEHPDLRRKKEEELQSKMGERHRERVLKNIDTQLQRSGKEQRHVGYGEGQREEKLKDE